MTPRLTPSIMLLVPTDPLIKRALAKVERTKTAADDARVIAERAERDHHRAILVAATVPNITISAIAKAAGCSRTRIYKRFAQPVYGQRDAAAPEYGQRPTAEAS